MKKLIVSMLSIVMLAGVPCTSFAGGSADVLTALKTAREKLVALTGTADKGAQSGLVADIKKATKEVDAATDAALNEAGTPAPTKANLVEFKSVWTEFQKTRDNEIIPAVLAGQADKAKALAQGVQAERFKKMVSLLQ